MINLVQSNNSAAIIGCGSVGSYLSMALAKCGLRNFMLMDNEILEPENIPRHLCSLVDASQRLKKVTAVKKNLVEKFSDIECVTYEDDILEFLRSGDTELNNYDIIIVAVGKFSVERRINYAAKMGLLKPPTVYLWLEPYGVAGQTLFINPFNGGCLSCCFDENASFIYSVSDPHQNFSKREAGCQTSYLPYTALDVEQFVLFSCKAIINFLSSERKQSRLYTWLGDLKSFIGMGYQISKIYNDNLPYTIKEQEIGVSEHCDLCRKKS